MYSSSYRIAECRYTAIKYGDMVYIYSIVILYTRLFVSSQEGVQVIITGNTIYGNKNSFTKIVTSFASCKYQHAIVSFLPRKYRF